MKRDNNGRFVKAVKVAEKKELVIGDKITSCDQLKEGMLVDFTSFGGSFVKDAIIVNDVYGGVPNNWFAVHNCEKLRGATPSKEKMLGKKYGWILSPRFGTDYKDMIFRGWYKPEVKTGEKVEVKADKNDRYVKQAKELEAEMEGLVAAAKVFFDEYAAAQKIKEEVKKVEGLKASGLSEVDQNLVETLMYKMNCNWIGQSVFIPKESSIYRKLQDPVFLFRGLMPVGILVNFVEKGAKLVWGQNAKKETEVKPEVKAEVKEEEKPVAKEGAKNPYKIGDFVKTELDGLKGKVIGVWEEYVWLMAPSISGKDPFYRDYHDVSPWVEPLKYKKGDLVLLKDSCAVWEILEVVDAEGYHVKNIAINNGYAPACINTDKDILRKVGVTGKE